MTEEEKKLYDGWYQGFIDKGFDAAEAAANAQARLEDWRDARASKEDKDKPYDWLNQFPPGFKPGPRRQYVGDRVTRMTGQPAFAVLPSDSLIDSYGNRVLNPDGTPKTMYGPDDVQGILRSYPYAIRRQIANAMKKVGVYGGSSPSGNIDQLEDFNAFARVLYTANQEGVSWDAALDLIAKRINELPQKVKVYKSTSIADLKRAIQAQASTLMGRQFTEQEVMPLAQRIQRQEIKVARRADQPGAREEAPATSTLIERDVARAAGPEADAYRAAQFIGKILKGD